MKVYKVPIEYPDYTIVKLFAFTDEAAGKKYMGKEEWDDAAEVALPNHEMMFCPLFELCPGMYSINKGQYGSWEKEDFEGGAA